MKKRGNVMAAAMFALALSGCGGGYVSGSGMNSSAAQPASQEAAPVEASSTASPAASQSTEYEEGKDATASPETSNEDIIAKYDNEIVVAAKMALDNFVDESQYDMSLAPQRWTLARFDDNGAVIGMTEVTYSGSKCNYLYVGTLNFDASGKVASAKPHYLELNGTVLGDDGYCDDVFDKLRAFSQQDQ